MSIAIEFITGVSVGIEFPGEGIYFVLHLGIIRVMLINNELLESEDE